MHNEADGAGTVYQPMRVLEGVGIKGTVEISLGLYVCEDCAKDAVVADKAKFEGDAGRILRGSAEILGVVTTHRIDTATLARCVGGCRCYCHEMAPEDTTPCGDCGCGEKERA